MKTNNCFFIEYPKKHEDDIRHGSLILHNYTSIKPEWKLILHGKVIGIPARFDYEFDQEIIEGDTIYFDYLQVQESNMVEIDGKNYLRVDAFKTFAYVRDGVINAFGRYVIGSAIWDEHEVVEVNGKEIRVKTKGNLVIGTEIKYDKRTVNIDYVSKMGEELGLQSGDKAIMLDYCDQKYKIEGKEYFVIEVENIIGKYTVC